MAIVLGLALIEPLAVTGQESGGNTIGVRTGKGQSLNYVDWLDSPTEKLSARNHWLGASEKPTFAQVAFDGKKITFEDENFVFALGGLPGGGLVANCAYSLSRCTLLRLSKATTFRTYAADVQATGDNAWVRLLNGSVAGGENVRITYPPDAAQKEKPFETTLPVRETLDGYIALTKTTNSSARQSGLLAIGTVRVEMDRDMVVPVVSKMLGDPALGVRGAAAWLVGELGLEELCPSVQRALDSEKQEDVKKSLERAIVRLRKAGGKP